MSSAPGSWARASLSPPRPLRRALRTRERAARAQPERLDKSVARAVVGGKLSDDEAAALIDRITWTESLDALSDGTSPIEAVFEDPAVKGPVFRQLDELLSDDALLASNTSSIPIAQFASWTQHPERVIGLRFFPLCR